MAGRLFSALAACSPHGLLGPPALQRLGQWAGFDLPSHTTEWAERGLDLNDEEDDACLMDFLDSAGGIHFCNVRLRNALIAMGDAGPPRTIRAPEAEVARAVVEGSRRPGSEVAATARGRRDSTSAVTMDTVRRATPRGPGADVPTGPSGRRWDYSRFEGIGDSSDEGSEPGR